MALATLPAKTIHARPQTDAEQHSLMLKDDVHATRKLACQWAEVLNTEE